MKPPLYTTEQKLLWLILLRLCGDRAAHEAWATLNDSEPERAESGEQHSSLRVAPDGASGSEPLGDEQG
jgi:hypothetical protein